MDSEAEKSQFVVIQRFDLYMTGDFLPQRDPGTVTDVATTLRFNSNFRLRPVKF